VALKSRVFGSGNSHSSAAAPKLLRNTEKYIGSTLINYIYCTCLIDLKTVKTLQEQCLIYISDLVFTNDFNE